MGTHSTLEGTDLSRIQCNQLAAMFMKLNEVFFKNSKDLGFCDKMKNKLTLEKEKRLRPFYGSTCFEKLKVIEIVDLEEAYFA